MLPKCYPHSNVSPGPFRLLVMINIAKSEARSPAIRHQATAGAGQGNCLMGMDRN